MRLILRWVLLGTVFVGVLLLYSLIIFPALTYILEYFLGAKLYWHRAPFLQALLRFGGALFMSILLTVGINNLLNHKKFLTGVKWDKLLIVLFCLSMFVALSAETMKLAPEYTYDDEETGIPFFYFILMLVLAVGYAMWPKKLHDTGERQNQIKAGIKNLEALAEDMDNYSSQEYDESPTDYLNSVKEEIESVITDLKTLDE